MQVRRSVGKLAASNTQRQKHWQQRLKTGLGGSIPP
jgi:hypothetical protein